MDQHKGVETLLGDPKRAIIKLSGPMIVALFVQSIYNLVDAVWVAGLGADALSAIGMFFPVFMIIMALASGIGLGGSAAISRKIGANDKYLADQAAIHTILIGIIIAIAMIALVFPFLSNIFILMRAKGDVLRMVVGYSKIMVIAAFFLIFNNIANGILRGEGDTKRAMLAMMAGSLLNIGLDPLFIYTFKLGVDGAAYATFVSILFTGVIMWYWLFIKRDTFVDIYFSKFKFNPALMFEILRVGIPSSFGQLSMAATVFILNILVGKVGGTDGIAVFTSAWRVILIGVIPLMGIAIGVTAVTGAAFGAKDPEKLKIGYLFGIQIGFFSELLVAILLVIFAKDVSYIFTYAKSASHIAKPLTAAMKIFAIFIPMVPLGMLTSSMFQGTGKGEYALVVMILRTLVLQLSFAYILGILLGGGLKGIWWGIAVGNVVASSVAFIWGNIYVARLKKKLAFHSFPKANSQPN